MKTQTLFEVTIALDSSPDWRFRARFLATPTTTAVLEVIDDERGKARQRLEAEPMCGNRRELASQLEVLNQTRDLVVYYGLPQLNGKEPYYRTYRFAGVDIGRFDFVCSEIYDNRRSNG
jgi:uncharacterized protein (DUF1684 family)